MNFNYELEPRGDYAFIDMKSFYASCEAVARGLNPIRTPLVVMSTADNTSGLILASSPLAKKSLGLSNVARIWDIPTPAENPLAKNLVIASPRMRYYIAENLKIQDIIRKYAADEDILWYSIDEGIVDLSKSLNYFYPDQTLSRSKKLSLVANQIQKANFYQTGILASIGMSNSNPLLAKLALDIEAKHTTNMRALWNYEDVATKVWQIPALDDFWGIGSRMRRNLEQMGIDTIKDLANARPYDLYHRFGVMGLQLYHHANGIDRTKLQERYLPKNKHLGNSQVLPRDYERDEMPLLVREMAEQVAIRLRRRHCLTGTVSLFIGYSSAADGKGFNRQMKIDPTDNTDKLAASLLYLFHKFYNGGLVRHIGVTYSDLIPKIGLQLSLFEEAETLAKKEKLEAVSDLIRDKFGFVSLVRASSALESGRSIKRAGLVGGHAGGAGGLDGL